MKILYALPATGNGHISRAIELYPHLLKYGDVDMLVSGQNAHLRAPFPIKYRYKGISLFYNTRGGIDYAQMAKRTNMTETFKHINSLPVHYYDCIISDFEPISAWACHKRNKTCLQWGHQASFHYNETPRPKNKKTSGELILKKYAPGHEYLGIHFLPYHSLIQTPVIDCSLFRTQRTLRTHIAIYLPHYTLQYLLPILSLYRQQTIHLFSNEVSNTAIHNHIHIHPISKTHFMQCMTEASMVVTGAGFETPAEAMFLHKKLLCVPIQHQYEQACNAAALESLGIKVVQKINPDFPHILEEVMHTHVEYPFAANYHTAETHCAQAMQLWEKAHTTPATKDIDFSLIDNMFC